MVSSSLNSKRAEIIVQLPSVHMMADIFKNKEFSEKSVFLPENLLR